jgi:hypothetical protein
MNIISSDSIKKAKELAIKNSPRLFGDKELYITKECKVLNTEEWGKEKKSSYIGNKKYMVSFILEGVVQVLNIDAASVKNAYNIVRTKYGIQEDLFMAVYEINQKEKKQETDSKDKSQTTKTSKSTTDNNTNAGTLSAISLAKSILADEHKFNAILNLVIDKIEREYSTNSRLETDLKMLITMINDCAHGDFSEISYDNMISVTGCLCYYLNPESVKQDIIELDNINEHNILIIAMKSMSKELRIYEQTLLNSVRA